MAGGAMLRYVRRAVRLGGGRAPPPLRSAHQSSCNLPISYGCSEAEEWQFDGDEGGELSHPQSGEFGPLPTPQEVQDALTQVVYPFSGSQDYETGSSSNAVQQSANLLERSTSLECEKAAEENTIDWIEPVLHPLNNELAQQLGHNDVSDAFQLLQTNPAPQEMVISLASDEAIWDAVLKNERVVEFRQLLRRGNSELHEKTEDSDEISAGEPNVFIWAAKNAKMKLMDYMEKITELARVIFGFVGKNMFGAEDGDTLSKALKSSLFLSVVVLLVIVVKRTFKMV